MPHQTLQTVEKSLAVLVLLAVVSGLATVGSRAFLPSQKTRLFRAAVWAYESQLFERADDLSEELRNLATNDPAVSILRGRILARINRDEESLRLFRSAIAAAEPYATYADLGIANHFFSHSNYPAAEKHFRRYLANCPNDIRANDRIAYLLQIQGRTWESIPFAVRKIVLGQFNAGELLMVGLAESHWASDPDVLHLCKLRFPQHSMNRFVEVKQAYLDNKLEQKLDLLNQIASETPAQSEPQAMLGMYYHNSNDTQRFLEWNRQLNNRADDNPDIWCLRGLWEKDQGRSEQAASCFLRALQCSVSHSKSLFQLSQVAAHIHPDQVDSDLIRQVNASSNIGYLLDGLKESIDSSKARKLVRHLETLHRYWEAAAWCQMVCRFDSQQEWAKPELLKYRRLAIRQAPDPSQEIAMNLSRKLGIPLANSPYHLTPKANESSDPRELRPSTSEIRFVESSAETNLHFQYFNGTTAETGLQHILQATGGASVVLDYDMDGWPDLYFAQSGEWPVDEARNPYSDKLFRNLGNGQFQDVSERAGLEDRRYSQGATTGDIDNDGDPDLIVTNVGPNRIYLNNGDGTFTDVSDKMPVSFRQDTWSTSAALVDLNQDGCLDLYVVNYVLLEQVLELQCKTKGHPRSCDPTIYDAQQDRVYLNSGKGTWSDVTEKCGFVSAEGKGLGIIATDFDRDGHTEIFVGNDTVANFYFRQTGFTSDGLPLFENEGILSGTALNNEGQAQASMGIAQGDVDSDGLLDLFVTNFYEDSNTLYLQLAASSFREDTRSKNLRNSGFHQLGFGTQFLDAELDGDLDLIITNGHIDRTLVTGEPDLMPPQLLEGMNGLFEERSAEKCGPYFSGKYLGRSLSLLDWNRDGLRDAVITHLESPVALLTNRSKRRGNSLTLKLIGTESSRDAIGARVCIAQGDRIQYGFVTGGDGYLSRNELSLHFGVEQTDSAIEMTVNWPSGLITNYRLPETDCFLAVIEGTPQVFRVR